MQSDALLASIPAEDVATRGLIGDLLRGVDTSRPSPSQVFAHAVESPASAYSAFVETYGWSIYWLTQATALKFSTDQLNLTPLRTESNSPKVSDEIISSLASALVRKQGVELLNWHRTLVDLNVILPRFGVAWIFRLGHPVWETPADVAVLVDAVLFGQGWHSSDKGATQEGPVDPTWIAFIRWCLSEGGSDWKEQLYVLATIASELSKSTHLDSRLESCGLVLVEWMRHIFDLSQADVDSSPNASRIWQYPYSLIYHLCTASRRGTPAPNLERIGAQLSVFVCRAIELKKGDGIAINVWNSVLLHPEGWNSPPLDKADGSTTSIIGQLAQVLAQANVKETLDDFIQNHIDTDIDEEKVTRFLATIRGLLRESECRA